MCCERQVQLCASSACKVCLRTGIYWETVESDGSKPYCSFRRVRLAARALFAGMGCVNGGCRHLCQENVLLFLGASLCRIPPLPWGLLVFPGSSPRLSAQGAQCQVRASPPGSLKAHSGEIACISPCVAEQLCGQLAVKERAVN